MPGPQSMNWVGLSVAGVDGVVALAAEEHVGAGAAGDRVVAMEPSIRLARLLPVRVSPFPLPVRFSTSPWTKSSSPAWPSGAWDALALSGSKIVTVTPAAAKA